MSVHVIGGGFGGLAAAISLAAAGKEVILYEQQERLGGKANTKMVGPFRFDTGPSLLTLPDVFVRLFQRAGREFSDYVQLEHLSPLTRYWFSDGTHFSSDTIERFIPTLTESLSVTEEEVRRYFSYAQRIWDITHRVFLEQSLHAMKTYLSRDTLRSLLRIGSIDLIRSMHAANASQFRDPRMVQLLDRYATYNGSDPYQAPATLNNIAFVEHGLGGYGVRNGIYGIIEGMEKLARELGVHMHTNTKVTQIQKGDRHRYRLIVADQEVHADAVVSDVDVLTLYEQLLHDPQAPLACRYRRMSPSSSAMVFYWGVDRSCEETGLHNIFFSEDYQREFEQIHRFRSIPIDPTIYINITSKLTASDAPKGQENWFVLVNAPVHDGRDWTDELKQTRMHIVNRLSTLLGFDLEHHIIAESSWTPQDIEQETGSHRGSLYGISSNSRMAAFLRHPNWSKRYPNLYFCGGSVHPGGGMPLSTLSGMIGADLLLKKEGHRWA